MLKQTSAPVFPIKLTDQISISIANPVIVFMNGDEAYKIVWPDIPRADSFKISPIYSVIINGLEIDIPVIEMPSNSSFRISDGRHRTTIFMLRDQMLRLGNYAAHLTPQQYEKAPTPFLVTKDAARALDAKGWLTGKPDDFDLAACQSPEYRRSTQTFV